MGSDASTAKSRSTRSSNVGELLTYARSPTVSVTNNACSDTTSRNELAWATHGGTSSGGVLNTTASRSRKVFMAEVTVLEKARGRPATWGGL